MKIARVNARNAGLKTRPICSFVIWNALVIGPAMSPRMAKTMAAVPIEIQLATKSRCLFMVQPANPRLPRTLVVERALLIV